MKSIRFDDIALTYAFLILRLWLGIRTVLSGLEKFAAHINVQQPFVDQNGVADPNTIVEVERKVYGFAHYQAVPETLRDKFSNEPLLPGFLTTPFYDVLGLLLLVLGAALLLGIRTRDALFGMGLLYTVLTIGLLLIGQEQGVAWLGIHVLIVAAALALTPYNRWTITRA